MVILLQEMLSTQSRSKPKDNNSKKEREEEREKGMSKPPPSLTLKTSIIPVRPGRPTVGIAVAVAPAMVLSSGVSVAEYLVGKALRALCFEIHLHM